MIVYCEYPCVCNSLSSFCNQLDNRLKSVSSSYMLCHTKPYKFPLYERKVYPSIKRNCRRPQNGSEAALVSLVFYWSSSVVDAIVFGTGGIVSLLFTCSLEGLQTIYVRPCERCYQSLQKPFYIRSAITGKPHSFKTLYSPPTLVGL